jgi:hypothetical protein
MDREGVCQTVGELGGFKRDLLILWYKTNPCPFFLTV